jgi:hypothetical protein
MTANKVFVTPATSQANYAQLEATHRYEPGSLGALCSAFVCDLDVTTLSSAEWHSALACVRWLFARRDVPLADIDGPYLARMIEHAQRARGVDFARDLVTFLARGATWGAERGMVPGLNRGKLSWAQRRVERLLRKRRKA